MTNMATTHCPTLGTLGMTLTSCGSFGDQSPLRLVVRSGFRAAAGYPSTPGVLILIVGQA